MSRKPQAQCIFRCTGMMIISFEKRPATIQSCPLIVTSVITYVLTDDSHRVLYTLELAARNNPIGDLLELD